MPFPYHLLYTEQKKCPLSPNAKIIALKWCQGQFGGTETEASTIRVLQSIADDPSRVCLFGLDEGLEQWANSKGSSANKSLAYAMLAFGIQLKK
jgi:hypothetical protein